MRFTALVPQDMGCSEQVGVLGGTLLAEEAALLHVTAVEKRRNEFAAGRSCARAAMGALGIPSRSLLQGSRREPLWPAGIVGSITHCAGYCAAVVGAVTKYAGLGIDVEPNRPLPSGVLDLIARRREQAWLAEQPKPEVIHWDRLLFSLKEVVFKIWYPLEQSWLGFEEAEIEIDKTANTFQATVLRAGAHCPRVIHGRFLASDLHLLSFASVPAPRLPSTSRFSSLKGSGAPEPSSCSKEPGAPFRFVESNAL